MMGNRAVLKSFLLVLVSLFTVTSFAAKKTFVYCSEASPKIFNPQLASDGPTFSATTHQIYSRLVEFEPGGTKIVPGLAKSWQVSANGLKYTFDLRDDVQFQTTKYFTPKRKFNSDDVLFSFNRMLKKDHAYHDVNGGTYEYFNSMGMAKLIKSVKKIGAYKVEFNLAEPEAPFLADLAMGFASILSAEYATFLQREGHKERLDQSPIGTGPFKFKKYAKDTIIRYEAHENYFLGRPKVDRLVYAITPDPSVRYQKLKAGECHLIAEPSPTDVAAMKTNKKIRLIQRPGLNVGYMAFNVEKKPFDNVLVRRAIHHALNRESYIKAIYLGHAEVAKNPIPPTMWSYNTKTKGYAYDVKKAKKLLKKAGFPNGFETELWTLPVSRPYNPNGRKMGELIQADLAKIGIKVKLLTYKWATYLDKANKGEHSMLQIGWTGDNGDPDNFLNNLLGCDAVKAGSNYARWCSKTFNNLVKRAKRTTNHKKRANLYRKAQDVFKSQAPWVTLAHSVVFKAMDKSVIGYEVNPFGTERFYEVDLK